MHSTSVHTDLNLPSHNTSTVASLPETFRRLRPAIRTSNCIAVYHQRHHVYFVGDICIPLFTFVFMCNAQHLVLALLSTLDLLAQHLVLALLATLDLLAQQSVLALRVNAWMTTVTAITCCTRLRTGTHIAELTHVTTFVKCINDHYCWSSKLIILISSVC